MTRASLRPGGDQETGQYATGGTDGASAGESATPAVCGDGLVEGEEGCDDGPSNAPGAACRPGCVVNVCGDGDQGPARRCDDGIQNGPTSMLGSLWHQPVGLRNDRGHAHD